MKKYVVALGLLVVVAAGWLSPFKSTVYARRQEAPPPVVSAELVCKTGKGGTETVVVSGKACTATVGGAITCMNLSDLVLQPGMPQGAEALSPTNIQSGNVPCALAQVAMNTSFGMFCANSRTYNGGADSLHYRLTPTTSLALPNGNLFHQWNGVCDDYLDNGGEPD